MSKDAIARVTPAPIEQAPLAAVDYNDPEVVKVIKAEICPPGTTDTEFRLFLDKCRQSGLNPLLGECFCVERWSNVKKGDDWINVKRNAFQAAEAGMAARAERFDDYRGIRFGMIHEKDVCEINAGTGEVKHSYNLTGDRGKPLAAWAQVIRDGYFFSPDVVWLRDFEQRIKGSGPKAGQLTSMWEKPEVMLPKCARAAAYRRAFPKPFAGVYAREELRDDDAADGIEKAPVARAVSGSRMDRLEGRVVSQLPPATQTTTAATSTIDAPKKTPPPPKPSPSNEAPKQEEAPAPTPTKDAVTGPVFCFGPGRGGAITAADEEIILAHIKLGDEKCAEASEKKQTGLKWFKDVTAQLAFLRGELERRYEARKEVEQRAAKLKEMSGEKPMREPGDDSDEAPPPWVTGT